MTTTNTDVRGKYVSPAIDQTAFNCPHCGAFAKQIWFSVHADRLMRNQTPEIVANDHPKDDLPKGISADTRQRIMRLHELLATGRPSLEFVRRDVEADILNTSISTCFNCDELCIWVYDQLVWPHRLAGPQPNLDLPVDIRADYKEASQILEMSPRGAAALLRLAIQKLCKELGERGDKVNDDIAALVKKGLDKRVQQALDVVRVIGNNAVHPGQIDLKDDRATAEQLFVLVNLICEKMISEPKHVEEMYGKIPEKERKAIEKRDATKTEK